MQYELISVIIPIFNTEGYLKECLESIIKQTYNNLQIILVDDASIDRSAIICDYYKRNDERIEYIRQKKNKGVVEARKVGLNRAKGKYVCFVDSDDTIDADMIEYMYENINDCDLLSLSHTRIDEFGNRKVIHDGIDEGKYDVSNDIKYMLCNIIKVSDSNCDGIYPSMCTKLLKRDMAINVMKQVDVSIRNGEDREFVLRYVLNCNKIRIVHSSKYNYRIRKNSVVRYIDENFMINVNRLYLALVSAVKGSLYEQELREQIEKLVINDYIFLIPDKLGFSLYNRLKKYYITDISLLNEKKIILYGAGKVGKDYYYQIAENDRCNVLLWVDKNWKQLLKDGYTVSAPEEILKIDDYDVILIANNDSEMANQIKKELMILGVSQEKIVWKKPYNIVLKNG